MDFDKIRLLKEGENWEKRGNYARIMVVSVQGENPPYPCNREGVQVKHLWDWGMQELVRQLVVGRPETDLENIQQIMDSFTSDWLGVNEDVEGDHISEIRGYIPELITYMAEYAAEVLKDGQTASGDDTYFDYFPDEMKVFWQFCLGMYKLGVTEAETIYRKVVDALYEKGANYDREGEFADEVSFEEW